MFGQPLFSTIFLFLAILRAWFYFETVCLDMLSSHLFFNFSFFFNPIYTYRIVIENPYLISIINMMLCYFITIFAEASRHCNRVNEFYNKTKLKKK